jgi:hypothetical protein
MHAGDFETAHVISDAVLAARDPTTRDDPSLPYHLRWVWDGSPLDGCHVLVRCYHGLGDVIQFARLLPAVARRAASLHLEAPLALFPLLSQIPGIDRLIPFDTAQPTPQRACDVEIMELLHVLRLSASAVPPPLIPQVPPLKLARRATGLCWTAGEWDPARSISLARLYPACTVPWLTPVSLQRGPTAEQAVVALFANPGDNSTDIWRTARLIRGVDLVVTVDTMVAHLAGTLGIPVWILLRRDADWRWMQDRSDSPWYPTARLYRQEIEGDWEAPLERLAADLRHLAEG